MKADYNGVTWTDNAPALKAAIAAAKTGETILIPNGPCYIWEYYSYAPYYHEKSKL